MRKFGIFLSSLLLAAALPAQITHVWLDPVNGSDTNPGTRAKPMKSIKKALGTFNRNAVVHLLPGVYGPKTTGDFWDPVAKKPAQIKMTGFQNFVLRGEDRDKCVIDFNIASTVKGVPFYGLLQVTGPSTDNVTICNLTFKNNASNNPWGSGAIQTTGAVKHVNVHHCVFDNTNSSLIFWGGFDCTIHDNIFMNDRVALRTRVRYFNQANGDRLYVYNNVFYNCSQGIGIGNGNTGKQIPPPYQYIVNNIAFKCASGFTGGGNSQAPVLTFEGNLAFQCTTKNFAMPWTPSKSNISVDPQFVNPAKGDFHIKSSSPCIDAGWHGIPKGLTSYALPDMANDFFGDCRMTDGNSDGLALPDIGIQEVNPAHMSLSNFGQGQVATWSLSRTIQFPFTAIFLLSYKKGGLAYDPYGLVSVDVTAVLFSTVAAVPGKVNLPIPKDPVLTGYPVYTQALGFRTTPSGFLFMPTGRITSYL